MIQLQLEAKASTELEKEVQDELKKKDPTLEEAKAILNELSKVPVQSKS